MRFNVLCGDALESLAPVFPFPEEDKATYQQDPAKQAQSMANAMFSISRLNLRRERFNIRLVALNAPIPEYHELEDLLAARVGADGIVGVASREIEAAKIKS